MGILCTGFVSLAGRILEPKGLPTTPLGRVFQESVDLSDRCPAEGRRARQAFPHEVGLTQAAFINDINQNWDFDTYLPPPRRPPPSCTTAGEVVSNSPSRESCGALLLLAGFPPTPGRSVFTRIPADSGMPIQADSGKPVHNNWFFFSLQPARMLVDWRDNIVLQISPRSC